MATDPDADRLGVMVRDGDDYRLLTGTQMGALLTHYILAARKSDLMSTVGMCRHIEQAEQRPRMPNKPQACQI